MSSRVVLVAPHLDDSVLSCWRRLGSDSPLIVTVFSGAPDDPDYLGGYDAFTGARSSRERMLERVAEDKRVMDRLGLEAVRLPFLDSQYEQPPAIDDIVDALVPALRSADRVLFPTGIGGHRDHCTTRDAVLQYAAESASHLFIAYADYPYAAYFGWPPWVTGQKATPYLSVDVSWDSELDVIRRSGWRLQAEVIQLSAEEIKEKILAFSEYETQYPAINGGPHGLVTGPEVIPFEVEFILSRTAGALTD